MLKTIKIAREELYRLVWKIPLSKLAEEMQIPAAQIAAACDKHQIPRPSSGYWMQREHDLPVEETPPLSTAEQQEIALHQPQKRIKDTDYPEIVVPDRIATPLPVIAVTLEHLREQEADHEGLVHTYGEK